MLCIDCLTFSLTFFKIVFRICVYFLKPFWLHASVLGFSKQISQSWDLTQASRMSPPMFWQLLGHSSPVQNSFQGSKQVYNTRYNRAPQESRLWTAEALLKTLVVSRFAGIDLTMHWVRFLHEHLYETIWPQKQCGYECTRLLERKSW